MFLMGINDLVIYMYKSIHLVMNNGPATEG
jgi:hypothetical protein